MPGREQPALGELSLPFLAGDHPALGEQLVLGHPEPAGLGGPVREDALRAESSRPDDVDHLLEVLQLALEVLDVLLEAGPLPLRELEPQVEQRGERLARP